ncbi:FtsX-like permease family protein [Rhodococcus sp. NPDC058521]|uniref:ABC transporter permease n=1 Tax=Rhodococcus sp. NPDC058521 TaxID=3346536 RepID=UPI003655664A
MKSAKSMGTPREHGSTMLVAGLAASFGVGLIQATSLVSDVFADGLAGTNLLYCTAMVFVLLSMYVAAIVTANTFGTIVAGRTRTIALLRLIGASAREMRRSVAREGLMVGAASAVVGLVVGITGSALARTMGVVSGVLPDVDYRMVHPLVLLPAGIVVVTTWIAAYVGSRRVLEVTPIQGTGQAADPTVGDLRHRTTRGVVAAVLLVGGALMLALGVLVGLVSPFGVVIAFFGGAASFTGILVGAHRIIPGTLRLSGNLFGRSPAARLASANALRYPERSTRTAVGLVIGVTLVVMFAVAMSTYESMLVETFSEEELGRALTITTGVLTGLVGFSGVIAGVGMVSNLSLSVLQRTRELGLLRALGFTRKQLRSMVVFESAQMVIASVGFGLVLGTAYGWVAAQSLLASVSEKAIVAPTVPWMLLVATVLSAALLASIASLAPSRRATTISPVVALAEL